MKGSELVEKTRPHASILRVEDAEAKEVRASCMASKAYSGQAMSGLIQTS